MKAPLNKTTIIRGKKEKERGKKSPIDSPLSRIFSLIIKESVIHLSPKVTQDTQKLSRPRLLTIS